MPTQSNKPQPYAQSPMPKAKGSLAPYFDSVGKNFDLIQTSIRQIIAYLYAQLDLVNASITNATAEFTKRIVALETADTQILGRLQNFVKLTAAGGGSTWNVAELTGYPYLRAVIIDPNGENNTLNLPDLGVDDRMCITVKVTKAGSGDVTISAAPNNIVSVLGSPGSTYTLSPGSAPTEYAVTLLWAGTEWQIIENSGLFS